MIPGPPDPLREVSRTALRGHSVRALEAPTCCQEQGCVPRRHGAGSSSPPRRGHFEDGSGGQKIVKVGRQRAKCVVKRLAVGLRGVSQTTGSHARWRHPAHPGRSARDGARPSVRRRSFDSTRCVPSVRQLIDGMRGRLPDRVRGGTQTAQVLRFGWRHRGSGLRRGPDRGLGALA